MFKRLMTLSALLLNIVQLYGQSERTMDSLYVLLKNVDTPTAKASVLNELSYELRYMNPDSARIFALRAYDLAESHNIITEKGDALMRLGVLDAITRNYERADSFFREALHLRKEIGIKTDIASTLNNLGLVNYFRGNMLQSIEFYQQGIHLLEEEKPSQEKARLCMNIAESYRLLDNYEAAIKFINYGIVIMDEIGDVLGNANLLLNQGNWYSDVENYEKAKDSYLKSLDLFTESRDSAGIVKCYLNLGSVYYNLLDLENALNFYLKAKVLKSFSSHVDLALLYQGEANIYMLKEESNSALESFRKSLKIFEALESASDIASIHFNIGLLYKAEENYEQALVHFQDSQNILDSTSNDISPNMKLAEEISLIYTKLDQPVLALHYSQKHSALQDSLNDNFKIAMIYKSNYEEAQRQQEILSKENELRLSENKRNNLRINAIIIGGVLWFLLSGVSFLAYHNRKKRQQAYLEINMLRKDQELKTAYAKLAGQDEERARIAQDLHDRVGSILSTVMLYFKGVDSKLETLSENHSKITNANELLNKAVREVRQIAQNIQSPSMTKFGLERELYELAELLKDSNQIKVKVVTHGLETRLPAAMEIKIYRIIQELLSNVLKHAQASEIVIQVNKFKDVVNLLVEDDGKGFNVEIINKKNTMGLNNVKSRVYDLHGSIIIDSQEGRGTTVTIDIPLE